MDVVHTPVLLCECLEFLSPLGEAYEKNAFLIDSTLGEGGHSEAFLRRYPDLRVFGVDADTEIQERAKKRLSEFAGRIGFWNGFFDDFYKNYPFEMPKPNLILFDLGISLFHYERSKRGFSFRADEALDMRLEKKGMNASDIVNGFNEEELANLIYFYGEEKFSRRIAHAICERRKVAIFFSSAELAKTIWDCVPKAYRRQKIHPATRTFQALRIAVNHELERLSRALFFAFNVLENGGKIGVITFHSLEDRIVKNFFRNLEKTCVCPANIAKCCCEGEKCAHVLTKKPILPSAEEIKKNPPSRSAKLRVVKKIREAGKMRVANLDVIL